MVEEMTRFGNWPSRLFDFVAERWEAPFVWGENDCVLFAADAVLAITGGDLAAQHRGTYDSALGAARLLKELGGIESLPVAAGLEEVPPLMAQRGDVVLVDQEERGPTLAVVVGEFVAGPGPNGVAYLPASSAVRAWRVG
jgi:hypothetical protein